VLLISAALWLSLDFVLTKYLNIRGFSTFFTSNEIAGKINRPNFSGYFGGPLDDFYAQVNIGKHGERMSTEFSCEAIDKRTIFLGDSITAGFEVHDNETFVSLLNHSCSIYGVSGINFGVRGYDTHAVIGSYDRAANIVGSHDVVFYLITDNDWSENLDVNAYRNMTKHFGRYFNGEYIRPKTTWLHAKYLDLRIFVSDNFYLTTKFIALVERIVADYSHYDLTVSEAEFNKMILLLNELNQDVDNNNAKLIVALLPCIREGECYVDLEQKLIDRLYTEGDQISVLPLSQVLNDACGDKYRLAFPSDMHLSPYGHKVISRVIGEYISNGKMPVHKIEC